MLSTKQDDHLFEPQTENNIFFRCRGLTLQQIQFELDRVDHGFDLDFFFFDPSLYELPGWKQMPRAILCGGLECALQADKFAVRHICDELVCEQC